MIGWSGLNCVHESLLPEKSFHTFGNGLRIPFCAISICLSIFFILPASLRSQDRFEFSGKCKDAYKEIIRLRLSSGQSLLDEEKKMHPDNLLPYFLENYIDFFVLFFNEDPREFELRKVNQDKRLQLMELGPKSSPFLLFTKSMIHFSGQLLK
jgi:hypothetical protein